MPNIIPIRETFLAQVRSEGIDDLGQPVERLIAKGGEPCRDAFRRARPGEALILASYCPFDRVSPYREYGPVFVLAAPEAVPLPAGLPVEGEHPYLGASFVLRAYSDEERIVDAVLTTPDEANAQLERLLAQHAPAFVLARFPAYGCYALRIEPRV
ncbi:DUF1203 domain-containing protein [Massilia sp. CF038]|uniref:DUF1203 domain-containing protein n=1 Tax=Massilia sp. CF038 TaxID=1881045 RepID=UPI000919283E|nr:DUF1203 domain-containing protein [Massilia sp. CF038]SHH61857.1 Protein of unknown function [Massilia sp. CF038]